MKNFIKGILCLGVILALFGFTELQAEAKEKDTFLSGIYIEDIPMEGKTKEEAQGMVEEYVNNLLSKNLTLVAVEGNEVLVTPADLGYHWINTEVIDEAVSYGKTGNIVRRYKIAKDLQHTNKVFTLSFEADRESIKQILTEKCSVFNSEAIDAKLVRADGNFTVQPGQAGVVVDEEASLNVIYDFITGSWNKEDAAVNLVVITDESKGTEEELSKVKDVLGTFSTSFKSSNGSRSANVRNGSDLINGTTLYPGDEFSTYEAVAPFTQENGYFMAGSYLNGQVVDSLGGGICQVSTTLYNVVLLSELEVTERHNHSMIVTYVDPSADAAIAESSGKDFKFVNNTAAPIYIESYTTEDKQVNFTIYGMETRDQNRQVVYESEVLSKTYPDAEVVFTDEALPAGSISVQSAHIGYKARLWKVVTENGVEVSRDQVNSSSYQVAPRTATVGVSTADSNTYNEIMAAIATNNIDHIKNVAAAIKAAAAPPAGEVPPPAPPGEIPPTPPVEVPPASPAEAPVPAPAEPAPVQ